MKKMLIFREGVCPDAREAEDYLYNSEVIRSDFIDMLPTEELQCQLGTLSVYASSWDIVFKDSDTFDYWHLYAEGTHDYAFEEPSFKAAIQLLAPFRGGHAVIQVVVHKDHSVLLVYRVKKSLSTLIDSHLQRILESYTNGAYHHVVPDTVLGSLTASLSKEEDAKHAKKVRV